MYFAIFDNPGTLDRYTLVLSDSSMYGFCVAPYTPTGFGQYVGEINRQANTCHLSVKQCVVNALNDPEWLGVPIPLNDLETESAKHYVKVRINEAVAYEQLYNTFSTLFPDYDINFYGHYQFSKEEAVQQGSVEWAIIDHEPEFNSLHVGYRYS